uniref:RCC1 repeat-containing protein DDB_G0284033 n=1 Tax=Dictyostelium discoideum TaxID=44689 RepID=RCCDC_DICDI|nr:RecName: Full=RCC1 repeat-containing protein DDB_G0284033 [Dictyostelium discoideum]
MMKGHFCIQNNKTLLFKSLIHPTSSHNLSPYLYFFLSSNKLNSSNISSSNFVITSNIRGYSSSQYSNKVYSWGSGLNGKLGHGLDETKIVVPKEIEIKEDDDNNRVFNQGKINKITSGTTYSIFSGYDQIKDRQVFYGCGDNRDAQLIVGNGKIQSLENIELLESPMLKSDQMKGKQLKQLISGTYHNACILNDSNSNNNNNNNKDRSLILLWGASNSGQIGSPEYNRVQYDPYNNKVLSEIGIKKISMGATFTIALSNDGKLYSFGSSTFNELGNGDMFNEREPKLIDNQLLQDNEIIDLECGFFHTVALTSDNKILTWGRNQESQCFPVPEGTGKGSFTNVQYLDTSSLGDHDKIIQIGASNLNSYILTENGNIYSIGSNDHGQCGIEKSNFKKGILNKIKIGDDGNIKVKKFYSRFKTVIVETTDGRFFGWGSNFDHQLALETRCIYFTPMELNNLNRLHKDYNIIDISISLSHCISLNSNPQK